MRRAMLVVLSAGTLALTSPGAALAHHHGHHHKSKSRAHHARVRFEHIGPTSASSSPPVAGNVTATATGGDTPSPTSAPASEEAGKVTSFEHEVLTITLNDGSTVSGKVTSDTEIKCVTTPPTSGEPSAGDDKGSGDDDREGEGQESSEQGDSKDDGSGDDDGEAVSAPSETACDSSALTPGTVVREAELRISSSSGAEFVNIELVK